MRRLLLLTAALLPSLAAEAACPPDPAVVATAGALLAGRPAERPCTIAIGQTR